jgi:hypothetical protein
VGDELVQSRSQRLAISELSCKSHPVFSVRLPQLGYAATTRVPKILMAEHKTRNGFGFDFLLQRYHKYDEKFLNHIVQVTGDETWVSFVNAEPTEQSMQ